MQIRPRKIIRFSVPRSWQQCDVLNDRFIKFFLFVSTFMVPVTWPISMTSKSGGPGMSFKMEPLIMLIDIILHGHADSVWNLTCLCTRWSNTLYGTMMHAFPVPVQWMGSVFNHCNRNWALHPLRNVRPLFSLNVIPGRSISEIPSHSDLRVLDLLRWALWGLNLEGKPMKCSSGSMNNGKQHIFNSAHKK